MDDELTIARQVLLLALAANDPRRVKGAMKRLARLLRQEREDEYAN